MRENHSDMINSRKFRKLIDAHEYGAVAAAAAYQRVPRLGNCEKEHSVWRRQHRLGRDSILARMMVENL